MIRLSFPDRLIGITVAILLAINSGCVRAVQRGTVAASDVPWCFAVESRVGERGEICVEQRRTCERSEKAARRYGSLGGIVAVDGCEYRGEAP